MNIIPDGMGIALEKKERKRTLMKEFLDGLWKIAEKISLERTAYIFLWIHVLVWTIPVFLIGCAITQASGMNFWDGTEIVLTVTGYVGFFGGFAGGVIYVMREH